MDRQKLKIKDAIKLGLIQKCPTKIPKNDSALWEVGYGTALNDIDQAELSGYEVCPECKGTGEIKKGLTIKGNDFKSVCQSCKGRKYKLTEE